MLNRIQKIVVIVGIALVLLSYLFPFWEHRDWRGKLLGTEGPYIDWSIFSPPPLYEHPPGLPHSYAVNYKLLIVQISVISLLTFGVTLLFRSKKTSS